MKRLSTGLKLNSGVYVGQIRHRRFVPKVHHFNYPLFMLYLDLDELPQLFAQKWFCSLERFNIVSFKREDLYYQSLWLDQSLRLPTVSFSSRQAGMTAIRII